MRKWIVKYRMDWSDSVKTLVIACPYKPSPSQAKAYIPADGAIVLSISSK